MTDITELAQLRAELLSPAIGSNAHLRKIALSLVEALEKAQETIAFQQGEIKALLSSLESRTVKIPYLPDDCDRTEAHYKYQAALRDAGIKVEAE
ncbi:TPA: hypothetical protein RFT58_001796 [Klebsiella pneumoniae subsp. pneumoniae]|uniref:hypothetical protein n=1 Tax=Klebsiella pneumoniae complex TaxID=3390273 RepID=UPI00159C783A|nr:hypothetical protein [Klebsiella pneumoniae]ELA2164233.1 hypothetical protein [Klebsiella pneumoniae]MCJ4933229.1 hypothetical protein [Klebsiella pneumoniae]HCT5960930.1 hypothetical protein [Klebsiella pneumoniae]HDU4554730.1 hypothetical protein [Klebsiella pneumoniae subsp. pneumoniae]